MQSAKLKNLILYCNDEAGNDKPFPDQDLGKELACIVMAIKINNNRVVMQLTKHCLCISLCAT
jgi:hypothetical protein